MKNYSKLKKAFADDPEVLRQLAHEEMMNGIKEKTATEIAMQIKKGDKGDTPKKGVDYFTKDEVKDIAEYVKDTVKEEVRPRKGKDYFDGAPGRPGKDADETKILKRILQEVPTAGEILAQVKVPQPKEIDQEVLINKILKAIPEPKILTFDEILKEFKKKPLLDLRDIKGARLDGKLSGASGNFNMNDQRWHGGGLSTVAVDGVTITGDGTPGNPLVATAIADTYQVKYDAADPAGGYLGAKIVAGAGITVAEGTGANENKVLITNTGVITEVDPLSLHLNGDNQMAADIVFAKGTGRNLYIANQTGTNQGNSLMIKAGKGSGSPGYGGQLSLFAGDSATGVVGGRLILGAGGAGQIDLIAGTNGVLNITGADNSTMVAGTAGGDIFLTGGSGSGAGTPGKVQIISGVNSFSHAILDTFLIQADRTYQFPDKSGTFALLSDVGAATLASTQVGFGNVSNELSGSDNFTFTTTGNILTLGSTATGEGAKTGELRFANGVFPRYVGFKASDTIAANQDYLLPTNYPAASGYALISSDAGVMSWAAFSGSDEKVKLDAGDATAGYLDAKLQQGIQAVQWDLTPTGTTPQAGLIQWNATDGTFDMGMLNGSTLQVGQEMYFFGKASGAIANGEVCEFAGVQGDHILMKKAVGAEINASPHYLIGVATNNIANGDFGYVTWFGKINGVYTKTPANGDNADWAAGDILYFNKTTGQLTKTVPTAPDTIISVAAVIKEQTGVAENGIIIVRPQITPKLSTLSDVDGTPLTTSGQFLVWNNTSKYWDANYNINNYLLNNALGQTNEVLHGNPGGALTFSQVVESDILLSNNTTNNADLTKHGFLDQLPGGTTVFKRGDGAWAAPAATTVPNGYVQEAFAYTANVAHNIAHNFGTYPVVQCYDASGYMVIPSIIQNLDVNTVALTFTASETYTVVLTVGSPPFSALVITAIDYSVLAGDYTVKVTASDKFITLPTAVGRTGKIFIIKNSSAGICDVIFTGGQNADGYTDVTIPAGDSYTFISDGSNYIVV